MPTSDKETQRKFILQLWKQGINNAKQIHEKTKIPLSTIYVYYNINKIKKTPVRTLVVAPERLRPIHQKQ